MDLQSTKQRFGIIGNSPALNYAISIAGRVAPTNLTVLIQGESGSGKESFSQIIHHLSPRKHEGFIAVNCGAIPEGTIDSELFGHEKGAFTGAHDSRNGYFETVNRGTIFLDEIGELPLGTQARLLRVLESGEYIRVGSSKVKKTDVRVIAATNVDLFGAVEKGKFREDLYYRLSTVPIKVPPLRDRGEDVMLLFRKFCVDFAERYRSRPIRLDPEAEMMVRRYAWPGNVRELKNVAEQLSVLASQETISPDELRERVPAMSGANSSHLPALRQGPVETSERDIMFRYLSEIHKDLNDLKRFVVDLAQEGRYSQHIEKRAAQLESGLASEPEPVTTSQPIIITDPDIYQEDETVEESLSIAEKENELIQKALKKHNGRRKDAAADLGISERTLYRKIKEYEIAE